MLAFEITTKSDEGEYLKNEAVSHYGAYFAAEMEAEDFGMDIDNDRWGGFKRTVLNMRADEAVTYLHGDGRQITVRSYDVQ